MIETNIYEILKLLISWPAFGIALLIIFFKDLKKLLSLIIENKASVKLPGNFELDLRHSPSQSNSKVIDENVQVSNTSKDTLIRGLATSIINLHNKYPNLNKANVKEINKEQNLLELRLYLKSLSFPLVTWIYNHSNGKKFSIDRELKDNNRIPLIYKGMHIISYCIASDYEKRAIVTELNRSLSILERLGLVKSFGYEYIKVEQNPKVLRILEERMKEVFETEVEIITLPKAFEKYIYSKARSKK